MRFPVSWPLAQRWLQDLGGRPGPGRLGCWPRPAARSNGRPRPGADLQRGPAQDLLEQLERVLEIESSKERMPPPIHIAAVASVAGGHRHTGFGA